MEELIKILLPYADAAAIPVIIAIIAIFKKSGISFLDWGKLNALHPLWMSAFWWLIRKFGVLMPIDKDWTTVVIGIVATALIAVGGHSATKNIKQKIQGAG